MVIDLLIHQTDDGFNAEVPSIKGCESWARNEDEVIDKTVELVRFYLKLSDTAKIKVDKARRENDLHIYKLIFDK